MPVLQQFIFDHQRFNFLSVRIISTVIFILVSVLATATGMAHSEDDGGFNVRSAALPDTVLTDVYVDSVYDKSRKRTIIEKLIDYIASSNKPKPAKKFDFSFLGGPYYTSDTKLGIGLVAAGIYRRDLRDSIAAGQFSIYGDVSLTKYFKLGIEGSHYFDDQKYRLNYDAYFASQPDKFWGIGYDMARNDSNKTSYKRRQVALDVSFLMRVFTRYLYVGTRFNLVYTDGRDIKWADLWNGQRSRTFTNGLGLAMVYNSRDNDFNAFRGVYARADVMFAPAFLGNRYAFTLAEAVLCHYIPAWKGAIIASRLHSRLTWGNTPWGEMSQLGGSSNMRGYWAGRYNDKCAADVTVELRQHLFKRIGVVVWGGVGEVFPVLGSMFRGHALWNCGVGLRWEFKHRINVRLDYGFGQNQNGFVFSINEAF